MLPSEAPMPPWAATVCERVGNTLESTATFRPARASCSEARMPEPPAPTMTTSNLRLEIEEEEKLTSQSPEHLNRPAGTADQPHQREHLQRQLDADVLHVAHQHVAHADPHGVGERDDHDEGQHLHPLAREDVRPLVVAHRA